MSHYKQDMLERMKQIMPVNTDLNLGINYNPQGPLAQPAKDWGQYGQRLAEDSAISFAPAPVLSQTDKDKQKYYRGLVQAGIDPSMARQIAGFAAPVKGYMDMAQGKVPFAQGDSWNISGTPFGPNPNLTGTWKY
jgi:hypothetical protein